jgi:hypothetical protein
MRFSTITALCAAPLALAGTLQADLAARGAVGVEVSASSQDITKSSSNKDSNKDSNQDNKGSNSGSNVIEESTTIDEVIIIWVNEGGGAATSTVTNTVTVTADGTSGTAAATHSVSQFVSFRPELYTNSLKGYRWWFSWTCLHARHDRSSRR